MISLDRTREEIEEQFLGKITTSHPKVNADLLRRAFRTAYDAHSGQKRKSGEPYIAHPLAVAMILAEQRIDSVTIAAGILHDVVEDSDCTIQDIKNEFGEDIALLVDGVTKIENIHARTSEQRQVETYRTMLLSMSKDIRVIIIKFADRLHNLRTLRFMPEDRINAIATETLDIYAPLAHRLGMARIKWELEDLAFKHLHPEEYKLVVSKVVDSRHDREKIIESFSTPLHERITQEGLKATVTGRPKHFYSIFRKMEDRNKPFEEVFDLLAIRVLTETVRDCYHVLGIIHSMWKPIQDRFKDYISVPKSNGYQSLHTTVVGDNGRIIEIQIRTLEMNLVAEDGVAAHWLYKEGSKEEVTSDERTIVWLKNIIEWQKDMTDSAEFYEFFKVDLFHAEIFVFTPRGDLITLPKGATVLDFAFAVHTKLGLHCIGARVDGHIAPIGQVLKSGNTVEILQLSSRTPSIDWLKDVRTTKARSAVRRWLKNTGRVESIELGRRIIRTHLDKMKITGPLGDYAGGLLQSLGLASLDALFEQVGNGAMPVNRVLQYFTTKKMIQSTSPVSRLVKSITGRNRGVLVGGMENIMVRYAKCCNPLPGDEIKGFLTHGRGISVHKADCATAKLFDDNSERSITVSWEGEAQTIRKYEVFLDVIALNRVGLLSEVSALLAANGANILEGTISTDDQHARLSMRLEIANSALLKTLIRSVEKIKDVEKVTRTRNRDYDGA